MRELKSERLEIRITKTHKDWLSSASASRNKSISEHIADLINAEIKRDKTKA